MGTSAGAALHIPGVCWEPRGSHIQLSTAVTAAVGYLCLAIRCFLPQNIWEEQRPRYIPAAATKLYLLISAFTDFLVLKIQGTLQLAKSQPAMLGSICPHHCHNPPRLQQKVCTSFKDSCFNPHHSNSAAVSCSPRKRCLIENRAHFTLWLDAGEAKPGQMDLRKWALEKMLGPPQLPAGPSICPDPG